MGRRAAELELAVEISRSVNCRLQGAFALASS
jgi:hypothetical protein